LTGPPTRGYAAGEPPFGTAKWRVIREEAALPLFDPFDFRFHEDPYPVYERLREEHPVYHNPERNLWALSRFEDVQAALRDPETFSSTPSVSVDAGHEQQKFLPASGNFVDLDPPRHDELRATIRDFFSPRAVADHEPMIREIVAWAIDRLGTKGRGDLIADFAQLVPVTVILKLIGMPPADGPLMAHLAEVMHARNPGDDRLIGIDAGFELNAMFRRVIEARRTDPEADIITHLTRVQVNGTALDDEEIIGIVFVLFLAGHDTTTQLLAYALSHLHEHPEARALLRDEPDRLSQAVEEFVRYESPVSMLARTTTRDVEVRGCVIPEGSRVLMLYGSANRDESRFDSAAQLDLTRDVKRHLAFGEGIHHCIGAPLARLEARVALEEFLKAFPTYEFLGPPEVHHFTGLRGILSRPIAVERQASLSNR
jgi:cytochrome P450